MFEISDQKLSVGFVVVFVIVTVMLSVKMSIVEKYTHTSFHLNQGRQEHIGIVAVQNDFGRFTGIEM